MNYRTDVLRIPTATESPLDFAQYLIRHKQKQYNLCGQFCVAYCMQDEAHTDNIDDFLDYWQAQELKWYQSVFQQGKGRTTGLYDLKKMLEDYATGYAELSTLVTPLDPFIFSDRLREFQLIMGVHIDSGGYLTGRGIPHWVTVESVLPVTKRHAIVDVYNPADNALRPYSWRELMTAGQVYKHGLWVQR